MIMKRFLTGLAAGVAISYLTAPQTGIKTRKKLFDAADNQTKDCRNRWRKTTLQVRQLVGTVKSRADLSNRIPNLFAEMESGRMDKYKHEVRPRKEH